MQYLITHHCKDCGLCDKLSGGLISFEKVPHVEYREACFEADRQERAALSVNDAAAAAAAYDDVHRLLALVQHKGANETQVRRIWKECFVNALEIIE